jgi:hypothetical protein
MSKQIDKNQMDKSLELCAWCAIPLTNATQYKGVVCVRCYKLLKNAGIKDEEIFKDTSKETINTH